MSVALRGADWFPWLADFLHERTGIVLPQSRGYLAETRLTRLLAETGDASIAALVARLRREEDDELVSAVINAFTTNETSFVRDPHVFDMFLRKILPTIVARRSATKRIRIWSAACSTGQEPYSIAMLLRHGRPDLDDWTIEIVASDLSSDALQVASVGAYRSHEIKRGLPEEWQSAFFGRSGRLWTLNADMREHVTFEQANLSSGPLPRGPFDAVFLRNVLIYFDDATRNRVFARVHEQMAQHAPLILGGAEGATSTPDGLFRRHVDDGVHWLQRGSE